MAVVYGCSPAVVYNKTKTTIHFLDLFARKCNKNPADSSSVGNLILEIYIYY